MTTRKTTKTQAPAKKLAKKPAKRPTTNSSAKPAPTVKAPPAGGLRGWKFAAAAAAQEAADQGVEAINARGLEAGLARPFLERIRSAVTLPKNPTWRSIAQALWDDLGVDPVDDWIEGGRYDISPYHLRNVRDETHYLYDVRGHEMTDPNPKAFGELVEGVEAVGFIMQAVIFTEERGVGLVADGRRRLRAARAVNLRRLSAASVRAEDPRSTPPDLIESIPAVFVLNKTKLIQIKNGSNYHRCPEDALRQLAGIQQLEGHMSQVAIAAMLGVTTQTIANQRSLAGLSAEAREALRSGKITLTLAYRLARELAARQDAALEATKDLPAKARQRAVEAWLAGESPEAEVRALRARDVRSLGKRVAENRDPELAPLRALFAVLRGNESAVAELPTKWRECLGLAEEAATEASDTFDTRDPLGIAGAARIKHAELMAEAGHPAIAPTRRQLDIDDGVPPSMRVMCPQCEAEPTAYCLGDGPDEEEQWDEEDNTRIHHARVIAAKRARMPDLPEIETSAEAREQPSKKRGRKGDRQTAPNATEAA